MKAVSGAELQLHSLLAMAQDGGEWSSVRPGRFASGKETRYLLSGGLDGPQRSYGHWRREKSLATAGIRTPDR